VRLRREVPHRFNANPNQFRGRRVLLSRNYYETRSVRKKKYLLTNFHLIITAVYGKFFDQVLQLQLIVMS
jgi:hypothetical protein